MSHTGTVGHFEARNIESDDLLTKTTVGTRTALGLCWIVYGIARVLLAIWLLAFQATATVMFGTLLSRVANPFTLMDTFHFFYAAIILYSIVCGVLGVLAGLALLTRWSSGRVLALCAGFLALPELPLGLMLGVYTVVTLLPSERRALTV
ncbi:MAG: hypothetical protein ABSG69_01225 [Candidatus Acidiferrum sp.]|jgi:hypothetical protein